MSALLLLLSFVLFDAELVQMLLDGNESAWQQLGNETTPPEQNLETLADLADKLARFVPQRFLKENVADFFPLQHGKVVRLEGKIVSVIKHDEKVPIYCCKMLSPSLCLCEKQEEFSLEDMVEEVYIFTSTIPQAWEPYEPFQESAAAFGVYVQSYEGIPVFVAPAIEWYPDTWLGNLGFNVASFDQVPASRVAELGQHDEETNRRIFKLTEADVEPFYGLLRAMSATPEGWLEEEAKKQHVREPINVADLFNRPGETRGKPVLLRGTAKRIAPIPVTDGAVQSLFGIDHYFEVYLFTPESRGNPIVVCVHSLPEGMPIGDDGVFSESIVVAAVPYKLWIYETLGGPHYAPLLVGRSLTWIPQSSWHRRVPTAFVSFSFALFFALALIWFACRFWTRKSSAAKLSRWSKRREHY